MNPGWCVHLFINPKGVSLTSRINGKGPGLEGGKGQGRVVLSTCARVEGREGSQARGRLMVVRRNAQVEVYNWEGCLHVGSCAGADKSALYAQVYTVR